MSYNFIEGTVNDTFYIGEDLSAYLKYYPAPNRNNNLFGIDNYGEFPLATILDRGIKIDNSEYSSSGTSWYNIDISGVFIPKYTDDYLLEMGFDYYISSGSMDVELSYIISGSETILHTYEEFNYHGRMTYIDHVSFTANDNISFRFKIRSSWFRYSATIRRITIKPTLYRFGGWS